MQKILLVLNPMAGQRTPNIKQTIIERFTSHNVECLVHITEKDEDVSKSVKELIESQDFKVIVGAGGDGTISDVGEALIGTSHKLGIIPLGSANNLAQEFKIPLDTLLAIDLICSSKNTVTIDAMEVNDKYYFLDISVGAKSLVIKKTKRSEKRKFGIFAYIINFVKTIWQFNPKRFIIEIDGKVIEKHATEVVVANAAIFGQAAFKYGSHIHADDGTLDVCILKANNIGDYFRIAYRLLFPKTESGSRVKYYSVKDTVKISNSKPRSVQADGEIIGETPVTVTNVPQVLKIITPEEESI